MPRAWLLPVLCLFSTMMWAQAPDDYVRSDASTRQDTAETPRPWKDRFYYGGGLGLGFGTITNISVEPIVGYKITRNGKLSAGLGATYWYYRDNRDAYNFETNVYGGKVFARYRILQPLFAHVEFEELNMELYQPRVVGLARYWIPFLYVGGGYAAHLGGNNYLLAMVLWDVLQDPRGPYTTGAPQISIGFGLGF